MFFRRTRRSRACSHPIEDDSGSEQGSARDPELLFYDTASEASEANGNEHVHTVFLEEGTSDNRDTAVTSTHTETLQESMTALEAANVDLGIFKGRATQLEGELRSARLQLAQCRGALEEAREEIRLIEAERQGAISRMEVAETKCNHAISFKKLAWENLAQEQRSNLKVLAQRDEALENLRRVQALLEKETVAKRTALARATRTEAAAAAHEAAADTSNERARLAEEQALMHSAQAESLTRQLTEARERAEADAAAAASAIEELAQCQERERHLLEQVASLQEEGADAAREHARLAEEHAAKVESLTRQLAEAHERLQTEAAAAASVTEEPSLSREQVSMCTADAESLARELAEARERAEAGAAALASAVERERSALEDLALCREQASRHSVEAESLARQLTEARECAETQAATAAAAARQERSALEELELFREQASRHFNEAQNLARQLTEAQGGAEMEAAVALQQLARCREQIRSLEAQVAALTNAVAPCAADREAALGARERNEEAQVEVFDKQSEAGAGAANLEGVVAFETEEGVGKVALKQGSTLGQQLHQQGRPSDGCSTKGLQQPPLRPRQGQGPSAKEVDVTDDVKLSAAGTRQAEAETETRHSEAMDDLVDELKERVNIAESEKKVAEMAWRDASLALAAAKASRRQAEKNWQELSKMCERADQERIAAIREMLAERAARLDSQRELAAVLAQKAVGSSPLPPPYADSSFLLSTVSGFSDLPQERQSPSTPLSEVPAPSSLSIAPHQRQQEPSPLPATPRASPRREPRVFCLAEASVPLASSHYLPEAPRSAPATARWPPSATPPPSSTVSRYSSTMCMPLRSPAPSSHQQFRYTSPSSNLYSGSQPERLSPRTSTLGSVDDCTLPVPPRFAAGACGLFDSSPLPPNASESSTPARTRPPLNTIHANVPTEASGGAVAAASLHTPEAGDRPTSLEGSDTSARTPTLVATSRRWPEGSQGMQASSSTVTPPPGRPVPRRATISPPSAKHFRASLIPLQPLQRVPMRTPRKAPEASTSGHTQPQKSANISPNTSAVPFTTPPANSDSHRSLHLRIESASASPFPTSATHVYSHIPPTRPAPRRATIATTSDSSPWLQPSESQYLGVTNNVHHPSSASSSGSFHPNSQDFLSFSTAGDSSFTSPAGTSSLIRPAPEMQTFRTANESFLSRPDDIDSMQPAVLQTSGMTDSSSGSCMRPAGDGRPSTGMHAVNTVATGAQAVNSAADTDPLPPGAVSGETITRELRASPSKADYSGPSGERLDRSVAAFGCGQPAIEIVKSLETGSPPPFHHIIPACPSGDLDVPSHHPGRHIIPPPPSDDIGGIAPHYMRFPDPKSAENEASTSTQRISAAVRSSRHLSLPADVRIVKNLSGPLPVHPPQHTAHNTASQRSWSRTGGQENSSAAGNVTFLKGFGLLWRLRRRG